VAAKSPRDTRLHVDDASCHSKRLRAADVFGFFAGLIERALRACGADGGVPARGSTTSPGAVPRGDLRADLGVFAGRTGGRPASALRSYAGWSVRGGFALAKAGGLPHTLAGGVAGLSQGAFLLEYPRAVGGSRGRMFQGSPTTRPTTSASFGILQDSGTQRERG
jgi:hypothetical protein